MLRALIVDDEPLARERVRALLAREQDVEVVAEARDGQEAVAAILAQKPDIAFLDVQMPVLDGFAVIERVGAEQLPIIIFTTAYDQYALKAFEVHALDYLLKPFDPDRFRAALERARGQLAQDRGEAQGELGQLIEYLRGRTPYLDRIALKTAGRISFVRVEEIDCVEACGNYVRLCLGNEGHLLRSTLAALEQRLDPARFVRIHRSAIVNVMRVKELQSSFHGEYVVTLEGGRRLTLSRSYRDRLKAILDNAS
jgi:two-component system, LytTR family, response regulator